MSEKQLNYFILFISILVPALVTFLFFTPALKLNFGISILPKLNALINSTVGILLIAGLYFIKQKKKKMHRICMMSAFSLSAIFLISYIVYHAASDSTKFGGEGMIKSIYYFILLSHIILAAIILPFILITISRALANKFDKHRRIARITWPLWLYVSVTGVIVYLMISPYYT